MFVREEPTCYRQFLADGRREAEEVLFAAKPPDDPDVEPDSETDNPMYFSKSTPFLGKLHPGRSSETMSAVSVNCLTKEIRVMVPPCLAGTPAGFSMAQRLLDNDWNFYSQCDLDAGWSSTTPPDTVRHIQRTLRKCKKRPRKCVVCHIATRSKCKTCEDVYYCGQACQTKHWPQHRNQCKPPALSIQEHLCIAVPDYCCFWQYQTANAERANPAIDVSVTVMSRERFSTMYGPNATFRTILRLALTGKPSLHVAKLFVDDSTETADIG